MDVANIISLLIIICSVLALASLGVSAWIWTLILGFLILVLNIINALTGFALGLTLTIFFAVVLFTHVNFFRKRYIVKPLLKRLKQHMPPISNTEREALEAGNTWWEKELFRGNPHWKNLFNIPKPSLSTEEQAFIDHQVEILCSKLNDWQIINEERDLPKPVWDYLKQEKFFGMVIPKEYGGLGFSALAHSSVVMKIATRSISAAVNTMVPNSLGPAELLLHYGTPAQKSHYLPRLAKGEEIPCFALTAPEAGSDAGSIPDYGIICRGQHEGKEMIGIRLSWDKRYITLAPIATVLGLAIQLYDPDHLIGNKDNIGITLCLIPTSHPGVEIGTRHYPLQLAFMNGPTRGKDVFIPLDWIIGGPKLAGQGWRMLMECLSIGRAISLPALATACGKSSYRFTGAYARLRRQFNTSIASFEGIEEALGNIAGYTYILEACRMMTAGAVDLKVKPSIASAIAKYHMTELSRTLIAHAMDVHAGHMIQVGPRNFLANTHFAIPISITVEGANILTRNLIIFGQGAVRCHPYLLKEVELITNDSTDIDQLDQTLMDHIGYFVRNFFRTFTYGLTGGRFIAGTFHKAQIRAYQKQLTRMSTALALLADVSLMLLGGSLKRRERISARLGDILSHLYLASAVMKYYYDHEEPGSDVEYVCWSLQESLYNIQLAVNELLNNYPKPWIGKVLRLIIFPFGSAYTPPSDELHKKIVLPMLTFSELRERLTKGCFIGNDKNELGNRLDRALSNIERIEPLWKKLHKALQTKKILPHYVFAQKIAAAQEAGLISDEEAIILNEFEELRTEIIKVNEFSFDLQKVIA